MSLLMDNQFNELPPDKSVDTKTFLDNVSHLPAFFDCLGSKVFSVIKSDINGNITKIRAVYVTDPAKYTTLQDILVAEREAHGAEWPKVGATLALMWLKRGLRFIQILLQSLADGDRDENNPNLIRVNVTKAYEQALKRYHGWIVQKIFHSLENEEGKLESLLGRFWALGLMFDTSDIGDTAALLAAPYRSNFLKALSKGEDVKEEDCLINVRQFLVNYTATVDTIYEMYTNLNAELDYTV